MYILYETPAETIPEPTLAATTTLTITASKNSKNLNMHVCSLIIISVYVQYVPVFYMLTLISL